MNVVTNFVRRIKQEVKDEKGIMLSTAVFASSPNRGRQKAGLAHVAHQRLDRYRHSMAYYNDAADVQLRVSEMIMLAGNNCYYYAGLATSYSGLPAWQNKEHIEASYNAGAQGYVYSAPRR